MKIILIIIGIIITLITIFMVYRYFTLKRESEQNSKLKFERIKFIYNKLENGEEIEKSEIYPYAKDFKTRVTTYQLLKEHNLTNLFPKEFKTTEKFAESYLVSWLEFPTELDAVPDEIEQIKRVSIDFDGNNVYYHVFKFRVNEPHWAGKDGWMLGVVGPYFDDSKPTDYPSSTFGRLSSKYGEITAEEEAKWVHENISMKR